MIKKETIHMSQGGTFRFFVYFLIKHGPHFYQICFICKFLRIVMLEM